MADVKVPYRTLRSVSRHREDTDPATGKSGEFVKLDIDKDYPLFVLFTGAEKADTAYGALQDAMMLFGTDLSKAISQNTDLAP